MLGLYAEREGFEPPVHCCTLVFKTSAFDHSAIPPEDGYDTVFINKVNQIYIKKPQIFAYNFPFLEFC